MFHRKKKASKKNSVSLARTETFSEVKKFFSEVKC